MAYETYTPFFDGGRDGKTLRPMGKPFSIDFDYTPEKDKRYRLFTMGETAMFFEWKCEDPTIYHEITDSLDSEHAENGRFCLDFSADLPVAYVKAAYKKILWPPVLDGWLEFPLTETLDCGLSVRGEDVRVQEDGFLQLRIDVRYKKEGISPYDVLPDADETYIFPFPHGSYDYTQIGREMTLPIEKLASLGVWVEGKNYSGRVYVECPYIYCGEFNILPDFAPPATHKEQFSWSGQHLSKKEWPRFYVTLNGEVLFDDEVFERCHRQSDWSVPIPDGLLKKHNTLTYENRSQYHDPLPYRLFECGIVEVAGGAIALVSTPKTGVVGKSAPLLVRTQKENLTVTITTDENLDAPQKVVLKEAGLHGIKLFCKNVCKGARFTLTAEDCVIEGQLPAVIQREEDAVVTGTGDAVYIAQDMDAMEEHLAWYLGEHIGNLITFRPVYRWCGSRSLNPEVWAMVVRVLNELDMKYVLLTDGRELPGQAINPTAELLEGDGFLGRQQHERDGQAFYWSAGDGKASLTDRQVHDMAVELRKANPMGTRCSADDAVYVDDKMFLRVDPTTPRDFKAAHDHAVARIASWRTDQCRHTGPSVMFKYMHEAGLDWLGAETMYSGMEALLAFLRGFAKAKKIPTFGVHHALQWCSVPHDVPEKYRRFRLALYAAYMLGSHDINTEEGLWRMEEFYSHFHRFDECLKVFTEQQQDFYQYTLTHSRKGSLYTPIGLIHGRYDGHHGFGEQVWGMFPYTEADYSWDLLKLYYPLNEVRGHLHSHFGKRDASLGWHSGTPYGQVDVLPVEYSKDVYKDYRLLAFAGYNCAEDSDMNALEAYVQNGGRLLLTCAHLTTTTQYDELAAGQLSYEKSFLGLTDGAPRFKEASVNGKNVLVCVNNTPCTVLKETDDGVPLLCCYAVGKGEIYLYNVSAYPAHPAICDGYTETLKMLTEKALKKETVWAECGEDVEFAVYDGGVEKQVYFLATDWYHESDELRDATLRLGEETYPLSLPFGVMLKVVTDGKRAVWCEDESGEVLTVQEKIMVQGTQKTVFCIAEGGKVRRVVVSFGSTPIEIIE